MDTNELAVEVKQGISIDSELATLAKGSGIALFGKLAGRGLQLILYVVLARLLGPTQYGLYILGYAVVQIGLQIGLMGLDNGVLQFGVRALRRGRADLYAVLRVALGLGAGSALLAGGIVYFVAPWVALRIFHQSELVGMMQGFAVAVGIGVELKVVSAATRISGRMQFSALSEDIVPIALNLGLVFLLVYAMKMMVWGAIVAVAAGYGAGCTLALFFVRKLFRFRLRGAPASLTLSWELMGFSLVPYLAGIFIFLVQGTTTLLVGYYMSPRDAGIYQASAQISLLPSIILLGFNAIFSATIPRLYESQQISQLNELFKVSTKWGLYLSLPIFLVIVLMPGQTLLMLYGQAYANSALPLIILSLAQLINTGTGAVGYLLVMTRHEKRWLIVSGASFGVSLLMALGLIPLLGIVGAALASACGSGLLFLFALWQVRTVLCLWPYDRRYWKGIVAAVISFGVGSLLLALPAWSHWEKLIVVAFGTAAAFAVALWGLGLDREDGQIWRRLASLMEPLANWQKERSLR